MAKVGAMEPAGAERMALPAWTFVGFTGHRAVEDPQLIAGAIAGVLERLAAAHGPLAAVASAASGADTLFLEAAAQRRIPYFLVLPFPTERFQNDFVPPDWERVTPLMEGALAVEHVAEAASDDEAYLDTGIRTVDRADVVVAVWDQQPAAGMGGTGDVVDYARDQGKPLVIIDPDTGRLVEERLEALPAVAPTHAAPFDPSRNPREQVEAQYRLLDQQAVHQAPKARLLLLRIILLHLIATAIAITSVSLDLTGGWGYAASGLKLGALVWALVLIAWHHHAHHEWLGSRVGAELCRSYLSMWMLRRHRSAEPRQRMPGCERLAAALRMAWYLDRPSAPDLESAKAQYIKQRVEDQRGYYQAGHQRARRRYRVLRQCATLATVLAIAAAAVALVLAVLHHKDWFYSTLKTLSILLPLVNAALLSLVVAQDYGRRAVRYRDMSGRLEAIARDVAASRTWQGLWRCVSETETMLLQEVIEWQAISRFTGQSH